MTLGNGKQKTLNAGLNQPQGVAINPTDKPFVNLYVSNSGASQIGTLPAAGGTFARWNAGNTGNLVYPTDLTYNAFADLIGGGCKFTQGVQLYPVACRIDGGHQNDYAGTPHLEQG